MRQKEEAPWAAIFTREHRDAARRIAAESFVLLKNEPFEGQGKKSSRPVLPLEKQGTVAVIGDVYKRQYSTSVNRLVRKNIGQYSPASLPSSRPTPSAVYCGRPRFRSSIWL